MVSVCRHIGLKTRSKLKIGSSHCLFVSIVQDLAMLWRNPATDVLGWSSFFGILTRSSLLIVQPLDLRTLPLPLQTFATSTSLPHQKQQHHAPRSSPLMQARPPPTPVKSAYDPDTTSSNSQSSSRPSSRQWDPHSSSPSYTPVTSLL